MDEKFIKLSKEGAIGIITLNRPPANGYDIEVMRQLDDAIEDTATDTEIKAVLVVSASEKFFCGGADIKALVKLNAEDNVAMAAFAHQVFDKIAQIPKIFIAVINGHAMGGGLEIALACDLRLAGDRHFLIGLPEVKLGLLPGNGGTQRLARLIGPGKALEMMLLGSTVPPQVALELGIINQLHPSNRLLEEARKLAASFANGPTIALAHIKRCVLEGMTLPLSDALILERNLISALFETEDAQEGVRAFAEKRLPRFKGQ